MRGKGLRMRREEEDGVDDCCSITSMWFSRTVADSKLRPRLPSPDSSFVVGDPTNGWA